VVAGSRRRVSRNHLGEGLSLVVLGTAGLGKWMTADRQRRESHTVGSTSGRC